MEVKGKLTDNHRLALSLDKIKDAIVPQSLFWHEQLHMKPCLAL